jgi:hypothetical protein
MARCRSWRSVVVKRKRSPSTALQGLRSTGARLRLGCDIEIGPNIGDKQQLMPTGTGPNIGKGSGRGLWLWFDSETAIMSI